jgi:hypothetical protein
MSDGHQGTVDLLEVFYARTLKQSIQRELNRLRDDCNFLPDADTHRRLEIMAYYERMYLTCTNLLLELGDEAELGGVNSSPDLDLDA